MVLAAVMLLTGCSGKTKQVYDIPELTYPVTAKVEVTDNYFGTTVADPYRWLENDTAADVAAWVKIQNELTDSFLKQIPFREKIKSRLEEIYNYPRVGGLVKAGEYVFYNKNNGLQNQSVIYRRKGTDGPEEIFMDPNS